MPGIFRRNQKTNKSPHPLLFFKSSYSDYLPVLQLRLFFSFFSSVVLLCSRLRYVLVLIILCSPFVQTQYHSPSIFQVSAYFDDHLYLAAVQAPAFRTPTHRFFFSFNQQWNQLFSSTPGAPTSWIPHLLMTRLPTSSRTCSTPSPPMGSPRCPVSIE
jgi:hypothetical protein